jgi:hypothetical protein
LVAIATLLLASMFKCPNPHCGTWIGVHMVPIEVTPHGPPVPKTPITPIELAIPKTPYTPTGAMPVPKTPWEITGKNSTPMEIAEGFDLLSIHSPPPRHKRRKVWPGSPTEPASSPTSSTGTCLTAMSSGTPTVPLCDDDEDGDEDAVAAPGGAATTRAADETTRAPSTPAKPPAADGTGRDDESNKHSCDATGFDGGGNQHSGDATGLDDEGNQHSGDATGRGEKE